MNPSSICFEFEAVLLGVHSQVTLEVLQKDKSDEHLDEAAFSANVSGCNLVWRTTLSSSVPMYVYICCHIIISGGMAVAMNRSCMAL